jgi:hypothetical protein
MRRFLVISSLAMLCSISWAGQIQAQYSNGYQNEWQRSYYSPNYQSWNNNYNNLNNWMTQYPVYAANQVGLPSTAISNQWSRQSLGMGNSIYYNGGSVPTLYRPYYNANGVNVQVVPYPGPNIYASPRYMYIPAR